MQKRDKNGKFMKENDIINDIIFFSKMIFQVLAFILYLIFALNYMNGWKFFSDLFSHMKNMGNKDCSFVCNFNTNKNIQGDDGFS